ncbi:MAG: bifunctional metallophosphatase/5'-nucleotidase [Acetatifactor sp.]|nr:bifunctional metallophosphatase/5'-nucleotidase [Acetatifactor sp.]
MGTENVSERTGDLGKDDPMAKMKKLTLLHSNDLHGDFLATENNGVLAGGVSRLSGYVQKVRREEKNVIYAIAGDMLRGSVIDREYKGISTIEIMNLLAPDVVTIGNHEADYGVSHLLFLEKCASFPIINANLYIKTNGVRLFRSYYVKKIDGMKLLFIGILTEDVLAQTQMDEVLGTLIDVKEAAQEVGRICDAYRNTDIDFTVLLTHIGISADRELAAALDPRWGVDMIIGGHSHTLMERPEVINGIPIVQAACGTKQIGRFDIQINVDKNCIDSYEWQLIPIDEDHCPRDYALEELVEHYHTETDRKYARIVTRFMDCYTHPSRYCETMLSHLFADLFREGAGVDLMLLATGSIRSEQLGPIVTYRALTEAFPFDDVLYRVKLTGEQLKRIFLYIMREEAFDESLHSEFYQISEDWKVVVSRKMNAVISATYNGCEIEDDAVFSVGIQQYHMNNSMKVFGIAPEELLKIEEPKVLATSCCSACGEWMGRKDLYKVDQEPRMIVEE